MESAGAPPPDVRTAYLARYHDFEVDIVLELLRSAQIFAYAKHDSSEPEHFQYSKFMESDRGVVMVDAARLEEARNIVADELPKHLESIQEAMDQLELPPD